MAHPAKRPLFRFASLVSVAAVSGALLVASCNSSGPGNGAPTRTRTEAQSRRQAQPGQQQAAGAARPDRLHHRGGRRQRTAAAPRVGRPAGAPPRPADRGPAPAPAGAESADPHGRPPAGRLADVEEADIYKVDKNRLFYLNTYRGFMIYDVNDPKNPQRVVAPAGVRLPDRDVHLGQHRLRPAEGRPLPDPGGRQAAVRAAQRLAAGGHRHRRHPQPEGGADHRHQRAAARGRVAQDREHHLRGLVHPRAPTTGAGGRTRPD